MSSEKNYSAEKHKDETPINELVAVGTLTVPGYKINKVVELVTEQPYRKRNVFSRGIVQSIRGEVKSHTLEMEKAWVEEILRGRLR
jgi:uncharacterized protein YbjQ (UPF0145 family)